MKSLGFDIKNRMVYQIISDLDNSNQNEIDFSKYF
jgi:hypothetical protein